MNTSTQLGSSKHFTLRPGRLSDARSIAYIGGKEFNVTFGHSVTVEDMVSYLQESYSLSAIEADLCNPLMDFVVAVNREEKVVGFAQLTQGTTEPCLEGMESLIELQRIYVDSSIQGVGIGKALFQAAEGIARQKGFLIMWLGVWEENHRAQKVYQALGCKKVGDHDFVTGSCVQTDWIMTKSLA